jgi:hypothetical protein
MSDMKQIEATVGKNDGFALSPEFLDYQTKRFDGQDFRHEWMILFRESGSVLKLFFIVLERSPDKRTMMEEVTSSFRWTRRSV